ncbi:hypothetical protein BGZ96_000548 [Linnemannia gamsii]|uniref:Uncharacterized protein n=1 Tax=Linnemannia gamsii TaxID=64522 RepID=A0ABQ7JNX6_9FUNG|nr:hypothetical protein BGZ96_000548 [Linnemannia gamsii]
MDTFKAEFGGASCLKDELVFRSFVLTFLFSTTFTLTMYTTNNFRYLRISKHSVLPLNLLLSKDDLTWFNDYSFQEILTMLKPLLLSQIELFNQGHFLKRTINPIATNNSTTSSEDGLQDAGFLLGGEQQQVAEEASTTVTKRTKTRNAAERPQFGVRFGFRIHTPAERGGAVLVANKNLGFTRIKTEEEPSASQRTSGRRTSMGLASLEGEASTDEIGPALIQEEDESDNLRVSDFQGGNVDQDEDQDQADAGDDGDYLDGSASQHRGGGDSAAKRKNSGVGPQGRGKGKRAKAVADGPSSQTDQKPTLQISYGSMKLHPQTLYIVVRSMESDLPSLASILPFTTTVEPATDKNDAAATATASTVQEDEDSLFPPGLDYFIDS